MGRVVIPDLPVELVDEQADWIDAACAALRDCAHDMERFSSDDVWARLDGRVAGEPRWMGVVFRWGLDMRLVRRSGAMVKSARPGCHRRPVAVWESKVFAAAQLMRED